MMRQNAMLQRGMMVHPGMGALGQIGPPAAPTEPVPVLGQEPRSCVAPMDPGMENARNWCGAGRVVLAGGALNSVMVDPQFIPFERLYRALPEEGMFSPNTSPSRPVVFELGAFRLPSNMALLLFDMRPDVYRWSGVDAGDYVPVEARRFGSCMGFDLWVDQRHSLAAVEYQLDPQPIGWTGSIAFAPNPGGTDLSSTMDISAATTFGSPAGTGNALMPQRPTRPGAQNIPFMMLAKSGQTVQLRCVIFHPIPSPIAFIEYSMSGLLMSEQVVEAYLECSKAKAEVPR